MQGVRKIIILLMSLLITTSCDQPNVLTDYSKTDTDEALFIEAQKKIDAKEWDAAITILTTTLSASYRSQTKTKERLMHAYGGKCGIDFLDLIQKLKSASSSNLFAMALQLYSGQNTNVAACDSAVAALLDLGSTANVRTSDQNIFGALLGLTRLAVSIKSKMDTEYGGLGDGIPDAGWDACAISSSANRLSDAEIGKVATGVGLIFENISYIASELAGGGATSAFDAAKTLCETPIPVPAIGTPQTWGAGAGITWPMLGLPASPTYTDFGLPADIADPISCVNTVDAAVPAKMKRVIRRMISSSTMGFGTCDITDIDVTLNSGVSPARLVTASACCPSLPTP